MLGGAIIFLTGPANHGTKGHRNQTRIKPMADTAKETTPAQTALFQMQFAVMMLNVGRTDEANEAFAKAQAQLEILIEGGA